MIKVGMRVRWPLQDAMRGPHLFEVTFVDPDPRRSVSVKCVAGREVGSEFHLSPDWVEPIGEHT